jgi:sugar phosphate permease
LTRSVPPASAAWLVWGMGACFYLIAFYQRVAPAVLAQDLSRDFNLSAAALGNLSAFYFYSYVAGQIPTGLAADRWGPRRVLAAGAAVMALGTLAFGLAPNAMVANGGRLLIGAAGGVAFVAMLKIASHWMVPRQFAFASACALFIGVCGATLAGAPLSFAVELFGWRPVMVASAVATGAVAVAIWFVVRDDPTERGYASHFPEGAASHEAPSAMHALREVLRRRNLWILLVGPAALSAIVLSFAGLWGVPFLVMHYGFTTAEAAGVGSLMMIAWSVSGLGFSALSEKLGRRKPVMLGGIAAAMLLWSFVVFVPGLERTVLIALLVAVGVSCGAFILTFPLAKESVPARFGGTASGIANMGVMIGGMVMQPLVGLVLDQHWAGVMANGARWYDFDAFRAAFSAMLAWCAISLVLIAFARETYCRQSP